ncbi:MAG: hypothetical protein ACRBBZ_02960 [Nitrosopumilus sp.]
MDKMILSAGIAIVSLGVGFLIAPVIEKDLPSAYTSGGYLWLIFGSVVVLLAMMAKQQKEKQLGALR